MTTYLICKKKLFKKNLFVPATLLFDPVIRNWKTIPYQVVEGLGDGTTP